MKALSPVIAAPAALKIIEDAREAELCRDIAALRHILEPVWPDIEEDPDFTMWPPLIQAKLLRLAGFLLTYTAKSHAVSRYHSRAKDLLTRAVMFFDELGEADAAAEAKIILAFAFWHAGEIDEHRALLAGLENQFAGNQLHPIRLQVLINRLMALIWSQEYEQALVIVESLRVPAALCTDARLVALYHMEAGILARQTGRFETATEHYQLAIDKAREIKSSRLVATNLNNLAMAFKCMERFDEAHRMAESALATFEGLGDAGWIAMVRDTQAQIMLAEGRFEEALDAIEDAISGFSIGEDWANVVESIWVRCQCLFRSGRVEEGFESYTELQDTAATRIGSVATHRFVKAIAREIYVINSLPYDQEVAAFKKSLVAAALTDTSNVIVSAAKRLGMTHQKLSDILNNQFPELYDELGIMRRARRRDARHTAAGDKFLDIVRISDLRGVPSSSVIRNCEFFFFSDHVMDMLGSENDAVVAVAPFTSAEPGTPVLYAVGEELFVSPLRYEKEWGRIFFVFHDGEPTPIGDLQIVGIPIAFCRLPDITAGKVEFQLLSQ